MNEFEEGGNEHRGFCDAAVVIDRYGAEFGSGDQSSEVVLKVGADE